MNRLTASFGMLTLTASLAACGGSSGSNNDTNNTAPTSTPTAAAKVFTEAQAKSALLVASDLPSGFTIDNEYTHDDLPGGCAAIDAAIAAEKTAAPTYVATSFDKGDTGFSVDEEIGVFTDTAEAGTILDTYTAAFASCPSWKVSGNGLTGTIGVKEKSKLSLGDRGEEFTLSGAAGGETFGGVQRVILVGNTLVFVSESGTGGSADDPAVDLPALSSSLVDRLNQQA